MNKIGLWLAWMVVLWPAGTYGQPGPDAPAAAACSPATTLDELTGALDDAVRVLATRIAPACVN